MNQILALILGIGVAVLPAKAYAICPVCTIAVGAGVGLSRWLGIDDTISGLWVGAVIVTVILWTIRWADARQFHFKFRDSLIWVFWYLVTVVPMFYTNIMGHAENKIWGIDKLFLGIVLGSAVFYAGDYIYPILKERNGGKAHFPFEKVVLPIAPLVILSFLFYFLTF